MMIVPRLRFFLSMLFGLTHTFVPNPGFRRTSTDRRPQALQSPTLPCFSYTLTRTPRRKAASEGSANPGDGFTFVDLQRELNRRQAEEEMARQRPSFSMQAGEAFMAEQMVSAAPSTSLDAIIAAFDSKFLFFVVSRALRFTCARFTGTSSCCSVRTRKLKHSINSNRSIVLYVRKRYKQYWISGTSTYCLYDSYRLLLYTV